VRRQVCKRVGRRVQTLRLSGFQAYREYIDAHPDEWPTLDALCHISISRFFRDRAVFDRLAVDVLPALAADAVSRGGSTLCCWSAGCASGEEPYSVSMTWRFGPAARFPSVSLSVLATDVDDELLARARRGEYQQGSLREVPFTWIDRAFSQSGSTYTVRSEFRDAVTFRHHDIRSDPPNDVFDLILCRNLIFTYFDESAQRDAIRRVLSVLRPAGALIIGQKEHLPPATCDLSNWIPELGIYRKK